MNRKIIFFGTPEFAAESLRSLLDSRVCEVAAVVTMPDKPAGRGKHLIESDVKKLAAQRGLPVLQPANLKDEDFISSLKEIDAALFVVIAFRMLPKAVWQMPPLGTFNLHASLLPRYRGAAPINMAVMNGDTKTGVTTFFLKHEIDTGDIIEQREIDILPTDNVGTVHDKLMYLGAGMVVDTVRDILDGNVKSTPQPEGEFLPAPKIFAEDCVIDWSQPAVKVHNLVRGLSPYPGARSGMLESNGRESVVKIYETALTVLPASEPGKVTVEGKRMFADCADFRIEILSLQPQNKKRMDASAYLLGYHPEKLI